MKYQFTAKGHENIMCTHKKTLEFIRDAQLSVDGDCIVGVSADFDLKALQEIVKSHAMLEMRMSVGDKSETVRFVANKNFSSAAELVIRFSEFASDRTFGFRALKAAGDINREIVKLMRVPSTTMDVEIRPLVKVIIFDFDDTIEEIRDALDITHKQMAELLCDRYGIYEPTAVKLLEDVDLYHCSRGANNRPDIYDRHLWFREFFKRAGIEVNDAEIDGLVQEYWAKVKESIRPMPNAIPVLELLRADFKIAVMSDSDGDKRIKVERVEKVGFTRLIDFLITGDDLGINKPDKRFYDMIFQKFNVTAEECVMVGDKPQVDLKLAKELGMKTVWMKHGRWSMRESGKQFDYVDHEITDLAQIPLLVREW